MAFWKQKYNQTEGFSLIEVMVSIAILGFVAVPMFTGLLFSYRLNQRSDEKLQAQLAVSNAVETIMAEGFNVDWYNNDPEVANEDLHSEYFYHNRFPSVDISDINDSGNAIGFKVTSKYFETVYVETYARPYSSLTFEEGGNS